MKLLVQKLILDAKPPKETPPVQNAKRKEAKEKTKNIRVKKHEDQKGKGKTTRKRG